MTASATAERDAPSAQVWAPAINSAEVQVGTPNGAGLWIAPSGTALPADVKTAFAAPWLILGYLSDAGVTLGQNMSKQDFFPWQSIAPVRSVPTQHEVTAHFILWQVNAQSMALYFDADQPTPAADGSFTLPVRADKAGHQYAFAIDSLDGPASSTLSKVLRIGFTRGILTDAGDMAISRGAVVPMECTVTGQVDNNVICTVMSGAPA